MEAAPQSETPKATFDFGGMSNLTSSSDEERPLENIPPPGGEAEAPSVENEAVAPAAPEEDDEDDLVVGEQLDSISPPVAAAPSPASVTPPPFSAAASSGAPWKNASSFSPAPAAAAAPSQPDDGDISAHGSSDSMKNPNDPRLVSHMGAGRNEAEQRAQERMAAMSRQGGGGGGSPGLSGLVAGAVGGTFKLIGGGFKALKPTVDPSIPRPMSIAERRANRDPKTAAEYYRNAGDETLREKIYRDHFSGMTSAIEDASAAEVKFQEGLGKFNDVLHNSPVKAMADAAQTSIGDYILAVKSGTIQDAAAQAVVQNLEQDRDFIAAESTLVSAGNEFKAKAADAVKKMDYIDTAFPGRLDTTMRKQQLSDMADGMKNDEMSKASSKVKAIMDDIEKIAKAIKDAIMGVVNKVASMFQPNQPAP